MACSTNRRSRDFGRASIFLHTVVVVAVESRLTVLALDGWMALDVVRSGLSSIYWRHTEMYTVD
jgi:hypothetical protein